ncbi:rRNA methylase [Microbacterium sp. TS-1]|nr:rRNA methylase [Microbacterium sp. TS-1]
MPRDPTKPLRVSRSIIATFLGLVTVVAEGRGDIPFTVSEKCRTSRAPIPARWWSG